MNLHRCPSSRDVVALPVWYCAETGFRTIRDLSIEDDYGGAAVTLTAVNQKVEQTRLGRPPQPASCADSDI